MSITDVIIETVMEKLGVEQVQIDKVKEIIDMVRFTKEDGKDVIIVNIGENVQVKITK
tara:strand:+ start:200 stop:373 length:174 start_codon:yes stop_codon:yes gene_type:complete